MSIFYVQNFLVNSAFATLFLTTIFYWASLSGLLQVNQDIAKQKTNSQMSFLNPRNLGLLFANIQLFGFFICRWYESQHFPLSNLYESLLFLAWSLTFCHFILPPSVGSELIIGSVIAPSALFITAFASLTVPDSMKLASPLVPALQSNWLIMHVTIMIISYSLLIVGSLFSIAFLLLNYIGSETTEQYSSSNNTTITLKIENLLQFLDNLSYRTLGLGFPFLTIGILSGAVWANQAWGSYWSWDPKETWALITWVVFAIYFHFRLNKNWSGRKPAFVASVGFFFLWICYLGVNLLGTGLHSYGWFS